MLNGLTNNYHTKNIISDDDYIKTKQIICANNYHTRHFVELIKAFDKKNIPIDKNYELFDYKGSELY